MSITYDGLKEVQEARQSKFSQALKKSSLEDVSAYKQNLSVQLPPRKAQAWNFKGIPVFLILIILTVSFAVFFILRSSSPKEKTIISVTKSAQLIKAGTKIKVKARKISPHKTSHHKIKKKKLAVSSNPL